MTADTDREALDRLEYLRRLAILASGNEQVHLAITEAVKVVDDEIDRLRKIEEAAREVDFHSANDSACTCSVVGRFCGRCEAFVRLSRALDRETP